MTGAEMSKKLTVKEMARELAEAMGHESVGDHAPLTMADAAAKALLSLRQRVTELETQLAEVEGYPGIAHDMLNLRAENERLKNKLDEVLIEYEDHDLMNIVVKRSDPHLNERLEYLMKLCDMCDEVDAEYGCFTHRIPEFVKEMAEQSAEFEGEVNRLEAENARLQKRVGELEEAIQKINECHEWDNSKLAAETMALNKRGDN